MLKVIRNLLLKIVDDIDVGNSNITEKESIEIIDALKRFTDKKQRLSKYSACQYLNVSRATFDNYVREGKLPRGKPEEFMDMLDSRSEGISDRFRNHLKSDNMDEVIKYMRDSLSKEDHFNEYEAEHIVSKMYHTENGRKYSGEKFDMHKAKEICERYRGILPTYITATDVYVAINSQYHDYVELFRNWFTDGIEQKIIESAIVFWFKDADTKSENKVVEYFNKY